MTATLMVLMRLLAVTLTCVSAMQLIVASVKEEQQRHKWWPVSGNGSASDDPDATHKQILEDHGDVAFWGVVKAGGQKVKANDCSEGDCDVAGKAMGKAAVYNSFRPGQWWADTEGHRIKAHSGGLLTIGETTYWYGAEGYGGVDRTNKLINVYSSTDLYNWKNHGPAFTMNCTEVGDECYADRPKVLHKQGGKYVMWMKSAPWLSVATSTSPLGPFQFVARWHPHHEGETTGDLTAFQDPVTQKGYLIYSAVTADDSRVNYTRLMRIHPMTDDLMNITAACTTIFQEREAPAVFYYNERYFLWTSGSTWWSPNAATVYASKSLCAPEYEWEDLGNPTGDNVSYSSQSTYILPIPADTRLDFNPPPFIYIADRFEEFVKGPESGRYVWLPIDFTAAGVPKVDWCNQWSVPRKSLDMYMTNGSLQTPGQ